VSGATIRELAERLYAALEAGDASAIDELLASDFDGLAFEGMPGGFGGPKIGGVAMREAWWGLGSVVRVRAQPREWIACADRRLLVLGRYAGHARSTGREFEAEFAHLWSAGEGRLASLRHYTDTALWAAALEPTS
jgi:ketosteroid isomerase-like protein